MKIWKYNIGAWAARERWCQRIDSNGTDRIDLWSKNWHVECTPGRVAVYRRHVATCFELVDHEQSNPLIWSVKAMPPVPKKITSTMVIADRLWKIATGYWDARPVIVPDQWRAQAEATRQIEITNQGSTNV